MSWADAYVIVYSICDACSFEKAKTLLENISKVRSNSYLPVLLLGNKTDLEHRRAVGVEEGLFAKTILILARRLGFRIDMFTLGDSPLLCLGVLIRNPDMHTGTCSAIESFLIL